jgi:hypothetical protein
MSRRARSWVVAFVVWTGLVWTTRIGNIWRDDDLTSGDRWGRTALAASFTLLALVVVVALVRRTVGARSAVGALAAWTVVVWVVRAVGIALGDHDTAFVVVHLVLAVVSVALAAVAWRASSSDRRTSASAAR